MLKFYSIHYTTYYKGKEVAYRTAHCLCDESKVDNWRVKVTWDNLAELWNRLVVWVAVSPSGTGSAVVSFLSLNPGRGKNLKSGSTQNRKLKSNVVGLSVKCPSKM